MAVLGSSLAFVLSAAACASVLGIDDPLPLRDEDARIAAPDATEASSGGPAEAGSDLETGNGATCGQCVPTPPNGWAGPFAYVITGGTATALSCADPYGVIVADYKTDLDAGEAVCGCTCGSATGIQCSAPALTFYSDGPCTMPCADQAVTTSCGSYAASICPPNAKAKLGASTPLDGGCPPQPTTTVPEKTWGRALRLCGPTKPATGSCAAGTCVAAPSVPEVTGAFCIAATGTNDCPADYPKREVVFTDATDDRGCTTCTCGAPSGATCSPATLAGFDNATCSMGNHALTSGGNCGAAGSAGKITTPPTADGGTCTPSPVTPKGSATPTGSTTICCTK